MAVTLLVRMVDNLARNRRAREVVSVRNGIGLQRGSNEEYPNYMIIEITDASFDKVYRWCLPEYDIDAPPIGFDEDLQENIYPILYRRRIEFKFSNMGPAGQAEAQNAYENNLPFTVNSEQAKVFMRRRKTDEQAEGLD